MFKEDPSSLSRFLIFLGLLFSSVIVFSVSVPFFQNNLSQAQDTKCKQDLDMLRNAMALYKSQNKLAAPASMDQLLGRYLQEKPRDPWGRAYQYDPKSGTIYSYGADGKPGGKGSCEDRGISSGQYSAEALLESLKRETWLLFSKEEKLVSEGTMSQDRAFITPFFDTLSRACSTFAVDVDTASFSILRSHLRAGIMPPPRAVRVEEIVNYFDYGYEEQEGRDFTLHAEGAPSPYSPQRHLLTLGIKARNSCRELREALRLSFVVDVSGSMNQAKRLPLVKKSLLILLSKLQERDQVALISYSDRAREILPMTSLEERELIETAIEGLSIGGGTNVFAGLEKGYESAQQGFEEGAMNRVILLSDGLANQGVISESPMIAALKEHAERGIYLSTVGFGMGKYNDTLMERLANDCNGNYCYIDEEEEAVRVFRRNFVGSLFAVAKDAKVQVEFNPRLVSRFRLLGYENRDLAKKDFRSSEKDGGEIGFGHSVSAVYEIELNEEARAGESQRLASLRIRYEEPQGSRVLEIEEAVEAACLHRERSKASSRYKLATLAARFAEKLRRSPYAKADSLTAVLAETEQLRGEFPESGKLGSLLQMIENSIKSKEGEGPVFETASALK